MAQPTILVNLERCIGCWTCAMACKTGYKLSDEAWRVTVRTLGNGEGIDRPGGIWPDLNMSWLPVYSNDCVLCAGKTNVGEEPYCVRCCPTEALVYGNIDDAQSNISKEVDALKAKSFRVFNLPVWEGTKPEIVYAAKR